MKYRGSILLSGAALSALAGCAINPQTGQSEFSPTVTAQFNSIFNSDDPCSNNGRNIGIVAGAVAGGVIGYLAHGGKGAAIGVAAGAGGGFLIGHLIDDRRCSLYKIAQQNGLKLASASITPAKLGVTGQAANGRGNNDTIGLDVQLQNTTTEFLPGSDELTPQARAYFGQIAEQYNPRHVLAALPASSTKAQRDAALTHKIFIVGHTDELDSGTGKSLATLSAARAMAVARVFVAAGVSADNVYYQGAGATLPISSNGTEVGRQENQRVEIVDVPTEDDLQQFLAHRSANPANYSFSNAGDLDAPADAVSTSQPGVVTAMPRRSANRRPAKSESTSAAAAQSNKHIAAGDVTGSDEAQDISAAVASISSPTTLTESRTHRNVADWDFGGSPTQGQGESISLPAPVSTSMFNFITEAKADTRKTLVSCKGDTPRDATPIHNLATGKPLDVKDYVPGFFGAPWAATLKTNLVALLDVKVPVDAGSPVPEPQLLVYKDYSGNPSQKPAFSERVRVNVYRGSTATLYRLFVNGPVQCMDMLVPNNARAANTSVYYDRNATAYTATGMFQLKAANRGKL